jgi:hypothetical protein
LLIPLARLGVFAAGDALDAVELLLPDGISVFAFDFSGSGHSEMGFMRSLTWNVS